jgi:hypothetical protein
MIDGHAVDDPHGEPTGLDDRRPSQIGAVTIGALTPRFYREPLSLCLQRQNSISSDRVESRPVSSAVEHCFTRQVTRSLPVPPTPLYWRPFPRFFCLRPTCRPPRVRLFPSPCSPIAYDATHCVSRREMSFAVTGSMRGLSQLRCSIFSSRRSAMRTRTCNLQRSMAIELTGR